MGHINLNHTATIKQINTSSGYRVVLILLSVVSAGINVFIITKYLANVHNSKKFPNYLLCCVAISDLFIVLLAAFFLVVSFTWDLPVSNTLRVLQYALLDYSFAVYLCTIMVCVLDRYICIAKPLLYRRLSTKGWAKAIILLVWLIACVPPLIHVNVCGFDFENVLSDADQVFFLCFKGILLCLSGFVVIMLILTCGKIKNHFQHQIKRRTLGIQQQLSSESSEGQGPLESQQSKQPVQQQQRHQREHHWHRTSTEKWTKKRKIRVTKASIFMTFAFTITFLPTTITTFCYNLGLLRNLSNTNVRMLVDVTTVLYLCSSLIDPCMTLLLKKEFRHGVGSLRKTFKLKGSLEAPHAVGTVFVSRVAPALSKVTLVATLSDSSVP